MSDRLYSSGDVCSAASVELGKSVSPWHLKHLLKVRPELKSALWLGGRMVFTELEKEAVVDGLRETMR